MFEYDFFRAETIDDVLGFLGKYKEKGRVVAGGTDLMVQIRDKDRRFKDLEAVMDITPLKPLLGQVSEEGDELLIGALCSHTDLENNALIRKYLGFLSEACSLVGSPQIRNMGTVGGSVCNASPAADPLTPLIAADAVTLIQGPAGEREIALADFYHNKGEVDLKPGEFVKGFRVSKLGAGSGSGFVKLGRRKALAISRLNAAVILRIGEDSVIQGAAIAPGCIFSVPERVKKAEELLIGQKPSDGLFKAAGEAVSEEMIARTGIRWSTEYKKPAVETIVADAGQKAYRNWALYERGGE